MKTIRMLLAASLLVGTAMTAVAQDKVRANVPFDFSVRGTTLPAGSYTIVRVRENDPTLLAIRGADGRQVLAFTTGMESAPAAGSLVFHRYGESYYLSEVKTVMGKYTFPRSRPELLSAANESGSEISVGTK
jgi:hypothetical protein